jgi:very-short-patch-repair endonuclease
MTWQGTARNQDGVISRRQLLASGASIPRVRHLLARGSIVRLSYGVYLSGGAPLTFRARLWAAVIATDGLLTGWTAGFLWGLIDEPGHRIDVLTRHDRRVVPPRDVRLRRWRDHQPPGDTRSGLPTTRRSWTVATLLGQLAPAAATRLADRALQRGWLTREELVERLRRYPNRPGNNQLRRLLALTSDGAAAESERRLHRLLRRAGITDWVANCPVWIGGELTAVVDIAIKAHRIAIEIDGMAYHVDVDRFRGDRSRQNALVMAGWTVLRFTWADLTDRPGYVVHLISRATR